MTWLTEEEAAQRWCPFASITIQGRQAGGANRVVEPAADKLVLPKSTMCVGSRCMAWQTRTEPKTWRVTLPGKEPEVWRWDPTGSSEGEGATIEEIVTVTGRCGLMRR